MDQTIFPYAGYEMRSNSEVMWARFMDALRVRWIYEPQVIDTRHGWYVPDFYLPACGMFLEVKGACPNAVEVEKAADAEAATGHPVVFGHGGRHCKGNAWFQGTLAYFTKAGTAAMSMNEICSLVQKQFGIHEYARVLQSRSIEYFDGTRRAGELAAEMLDAWMTRPELEESKRRIHSPLNHKTESTHGQASIAEVFAAGFVRKVQTSRTQRGAA